jgi:hypothetical protein
MIAKRLDECADAEQVHLGKIGLDDLNTSPISSVGLFCRCLWHRFA